MSVRCIKRANTTTSTARNAIKNSLLKELIIDIYVDQIIMIEAAQEEYVIGLVNLTEEASLTDKYGPNRLFTYIHHTRVGVRCLFHNSEDVKRIYIGKSKVSPRLILLCIERKSKVSKVSKVF